MLALLTETTPKVMPKTDQEVGLERKEERTYKLSLKTVIPLTSPRWVALFLSQHDSPKPRFVLPLVLEDAVAAKFCAALCGFPWAGSS